MYRGYKDLDELMLERHPADSPPARKRRKRNSVFRKASALALSAVLFGGVAGGTFYGVNNFLTNAYAAQDISGSPSALTPLSYSSGQENASQMLPLFA